MKIKHPLSIIIASFMATAAFMSMSAPAQVLRGHNSNAPVDFSAGQLEVQDNADRVILSGGVVATQAGLTIRAARLTGAYTNTGKIDVNRIDAIGGVQITKDDLRATSNSAVYDLDQSLITLIGDVNLVQGPNKLNGGRIVIDLNAGRSTITGSTAPARAGDVSQQSNGRVTGRFNVPQRNN
jgi:lipopolysaccharide export system protein LptA